MVAVSTNIRIIVGHYGNGKTEFAVNYALWRRSLGHAVAIADLDIVNPYFRTRQQAEVLGARGIHVVSNNFGNDWRADVPAISGEVHSFFVRTDRENIVDVGGNAVGARVLARFRGMIPESGCDMWLVCNANRFETQTAAQAIAFAEKIGSASGLKPTGIINNTHMLQETTLEDILRGNEVASEICRELNLPCVYTVCPRSLEKECRKAQLLGELFPIDMHMRPDYLLT